MSDRGRPHRPEEPVLGPGPKEPVLGPDETNINRETQHHLFHGGVVKARVESLDKASVAL